MRRILPRKVRCPYCTKPLDAVPRWKEECPHCGGPVFVRDGKPVTKKRAEEIDHRNGNNRRLTPEVARRDLLRYKASGVVVAVEIRSPLDKQTCYDCTQLHGQRFTINEALEHMPIPTACQSENGCRCVYVPVHK
jgi:hypothetical protein